MKMKRRINNMERTYFTLKEMLFSILGEPGEDIVYDTVTVEDTFLTRKTANGNDFTDDTSATIQTLAGHSEVCTNLLSDDDFNAAVATASDGIITGTYAAGDIIIGNKTYTAGTYTISIKVNTATANDSYIAIYNNTVSTGVRVSSLMTVGTFTYTFTITESSIIRYYISGVSADNINMQMWINSGSTALPYETYYSGIKSATATTITSANTNGTLTSTFTIPTAIRALNGYGVEGNIVDFKNGTYTQNNEIVGGVLNALGTPVVTDISSYITTDTYRVYNGGTETFDGTIATYLLVDYLLKSDVDQYDNKFKAFDSYQFTAYDDDELQLTALMAKFNDGFSTSIATYVTSPIIKRLWSNYIIPTCWNCEVAYMNDYDKDNDDVYDVYYDKFASMCAWITQTSVKNIDMIELYESYTSKLMEELTQVSASTSSFNDTPQGIEDYTDDEHNTNTSKSGNTTTSTVASVSARLNEANALYENLFIKWADDFYKHFSIF